MPTTDTLRDPAPHVTLHAYLDTYSGDVGIYGGVVRFCQSQGCLPEQGQEIHPKVDLAYGQEGVVALLSLIEHWSGCTGVKAAPDEVQFTSPGIRKATTFTLHPEAKDRLRRISKEHKISMSRMIERLILNH